MNLVRFELVDEKTQERLVMEVPEEYLVKRRARPGPDNGLLVIETVFRDSKPGPPFITGRSDFTGSRARVEAEAQYAKDRVIIELWGKVMSKQYPINITRDLLVHKDRLEDNVAGLRRFGTCDAASPSTEARSSQPTIASRTPAMACRQVMVTEDYIPETYAPPQAWAYFNCERLDQNPQASCTGRSVYRGRNFAYIVRRSELARWKAFDHELRELLERFVVSDSLEKHSK